MNNRRLLKHLPGLAASDGDGVKLTRLIGSPQLDRLDPFLLLDCFESDEAEDYIGGFPTHPHRGFETVTYLLNGRMRHKDNAGHEGVIEPGGVQWMTAGKGILHSEMPEQENGLLRGFQLWVNLPSSAKMTTPKYQEFSPDQTPLESRENGTEIRVIAGQTDQGTRGPIKNEYTEPTYLDITLPAELEFNQTITMSHNAFIYVISGDVSVHTDTDTVGEKKLGILGPGENVSVRSGQTTSRFLLIAGKPLKEPVARSGPFVMNTREELMQAFKDFNQGRF
jgi:redox-sensitive bicupin YhaK (pirin superfamily)